jgi:hypothetical protein
VKDRWDEETGGRKAHYEALRVKRIADRKEGPRGSRKKEEAFGLDQRCREGENHMGPLSLTRSQPEPSCLLWSA